MKLKPENERKHLRLPDYDYSTTGFYYVTLCTQNRECLFGNITNGKMLLNDSGEMVNEVWRLLPNQYPNIEMDTYTIMPNHLHGIIFITEGTAQRPSATLSNIIKNFKTYSSYCYIEGVRKHGWASYEKRLWQRSFYEHVIRNDESLSKIQQYIINNPLKWELDKENPINIKD